MSEETAANGGTEQAAKKTRKPRSASKYVGLTTVVDPANMGRPVWVVSYAGKSPKDIKAQVKDENEIV